ncbi:MAG TPA: nitrogen regulation protein NR(II) [Steroidobacteraceae bacterium]|nr:nitrogen regulation protein NR(II) [Steroidobacteraceae bacterium]
MVAEYRSPSALAHFDPAELLDTLSTGILVLDAHLCPIYANVAAQDLLAFSLNMSRGRPFGDFLQDGGALHAMLRRALESGEGLANRELQLKPTAAGPARETRSLDVTVTPLAGLTGTHLLLELADTTQRQRISRDNDLLARLDGSRLMIRQLAHEIKNPLGGLRGAAQLLERELPAASLREYTQVIIGEADRLTALVDSIAGPSRPPSKTLMNVHEICEHVYHLLRAEARSGILVERDYDPSLPNAMLDRHQLIQALLNVGRNALQAQGDSGHVILRTRARANVTIGSVRHRLVAAVQVEDSGPGVPAQLRASIFYPLVTGRPNGTGLGLAVAQELVTRNGGIIEFESEPRHTVFTLLLPLGEES